jgi:hypothetical protein
VAEGDAERRRAESAEEALRRSESRETVLHERLRAAEAELARFQAEMKYSRQSPKSG